MKPSATIATCRAEAPPEQLHRRARGNRLLARDDLVEAAVFRVQEVAGASARAHLLASRRGTAMLS